MTPPTHCQQCGCLLLGGATVHRNGCPYIAMIARFTEGLQQLTHFLGIDVAHYTKEELVKVIKIMGKQYDMQVHGYKVAADLFSSSAKRNLDILQSTRDALGIARFAGVAINHISNALGQNQNQQHNEDEP